MADSFRDLALRPLPPEIYREALRLGATARLDAGDYGWILMAAAAMITHSPVLRSVPRPGLVSGTLVVVTALILTCALMIAGWVGAHGWTGYIAAEIRDLEDRRAQLELVAPPPWATRWIQAADGGEGMLFAAGHRPDQFLALPCSVGTTEGICVVIKD